MESKVLIQLKEEVSRGGGADKIVEGLKNAAGFADELNKLMGTELPKHLETVLSKLTAMTTSLGVINNQMKAMGLSTSTPGGGTTAAPAGQRGGAGDLATGSADELKKARAGGTGGGGGGVGIGQFLSRIIPSPLAPVFNAIPYAGVVGALIQATRTGLGVGEFADLYGARSNIANRQITTGADEGALGGSPTQAMLENMGIGAAARYKEGGTPGAWAARMQTKGSLLLGNAWKLFTDPASMQSMEQADAAALDRRRTLDEQTYYYSNKANRQQMQASRGAMSFLERTEGLQASASMMERARGQRTTAEEMMPLMDVARKYGHKISTTGPSAAEEYSATLDEDPYIASRRAIIEGANAKIDNLSGGIGGTSRRERNAAEAARDQAQLEATNYRQQKTAWALASGRTRSDFLRDSGTLGTEYGVSSDMTSELLRRTGGEAGTMSTSAITGFLARSGLGGAETLASRQELTQYAGKFLQQNRQSSMGIENQLGGIEAFTYGGVKAAQAAGFGGASTQVGTELGIKAQSMQQQMSSTPMNMARLSGMAFLGSLGMGAVGADIGVKNIPGMDLPQLEALATKLKFTGGGEEFRRRVMGSSITEYGQEVAKSLITPADKFLEESMGLKSDSLAAMYSTGISSGKDAKIVQDLLVSGGERPTGPVEAPDRSKITAEDLRKQQQTQVDAEGRKIFGMTEDELRSTMKSIFVTAAQAMVGELKLAPGIKGKAFGGTGKGE